MESDIEGLEPVNLGNPEERTVKELLEAIVALLDRRVTVAHLPLPIDDPRRRRPDISRAEALLGWRPRMPLKEGLASTVAWFAEEICAGDGDPRLIKVAVPAE
jgi:nucleoside-diphosphate-sugar epimerase